LDAFIADDHVNETSFEIVSTDSASLDRLPGIESVGARCLRHSIDLHNSLERFCFVARNLFRVSLFAFLQWLLFFNHFLSSPMIAERCRFFPPRD